MITLRLLGNLTAVGGERVLEWEMKGPITLKQFFLDHKEEIPQVIKLWEENECMFTVGTRIAAEVTVVKDGDVVKVTPHNSQLNSADFPIGHGGTQ
ncbi:MAG: hypothetical protein HY284_03840 [Nitrospirae bacterium]|nr:hypothetical protein [Nitrospirota bacterium]